MRDALEELGAVSESHSRLPSSLRRALRECDPIALARAAAAHQLARMIPRVLAGEIHPSNALPLIELDEALEHLQVTCPGLAAQQEDRSR